MLDVSSATVRLFVHVLAASVWVGGQLTVAGLLPTLRRLGDDAPRQVARRFSAIAWVAYAVLVATGVWNLFAVDIGATSTEYQVTLFVKLGFVALSGAAAIGHTLARSRVMIALGGALGGVAAIAAVWFGVMLRT